MKKLFCLALSAAMLVSLAACGSTVNPENTDPVITAEPLPAATEAVTSAPENLTAEGSGTYFVQVGDKVYFHSYGADSFYGYGLEGQFHGYTNRTGRNTLCAYDTTTGEVTELLSDTGFGEIFYAREKLWFSDETGFCSVSLDGTGASCVRTTDREHSRLVGVDEESGIAVVEYYNDSYEGAIEFYNGAGCVDTISSEGYGISYHCAAMDDGILCYYGTEYLEGEDNASRQIITLYSCELSSLKNSVLGEVPESDSEDSIYREIEQCIISGDKIHLIVTDRFSWRMSEKAWQLEATAGEQFSVSIVEEYPHTFDSGFVPVMSEKDGKIQTAEHAPDYAYVDDSGDLYIFDDADKGPTVKNLAERGSGPVFEFIENPVLIGDYLYLYMGRGIYDSFMASSAGESYDLLSSRVCAVNTVTGEVETIAVEDTAPLTKLGRIWSCSEGGREIIELQPIMPSDNPKYYDYSAWVALPLELSDDITVTIKGDLEHDPVKVYDRTELLTFLDGRSAVDYAPESAQYMGCFNIPEDKPASYPIYAYVTLDGEGRVINVETGAEVNIEYDVRCTDVDLLGEWNMIWMDTDEGDNDYNPAEDGIFYFLDVFEIDGVPYCNFENVYDGGEVRFKDMPLECHFDDYGGLSSAYATGTATWFVNGSESFESTVELQIGLSDPNSLYATAVFSSGAGVYGYYGRSCG